MTRRLVVFYSWSGTTAKVAKAVAEQLSADLEEIRDVTPRAGVLGYVRSGFEAWNQRPAPIQPPLKNAADYDVVILGCPVWAHGMASPMRSYIIREKAKFKNVAFFCTLGGAYGEKAIASLATLCDRPPIAELLIAARSLKSGQWRKATLDFAQKVRTATEPHDAAAAAA